MSKRPKNELERLRDVGAEILDALDAFGHMSREHLAEVTGHNERTVRAAIAVLNADGYPVVSDGHAFTADPTPSELRTAYARLMSAARHIELRCAGLARIMRRRGMRLSEQPTLPFGPEVSDRHATPASLT
jgi:biotin operon repressor